MAYGRLKPGTWPDYGLILKNILTALIKAYDTACCTLTSFTEVKYGRLMFDLKRPSTFNTIKLSDL